MNLPYAHGGPVLSGRLRESPEDFFVDEQLGFEPSGAGEHALLHVEKRGANTAHVARELARFAGVPELAVGFAGMKDRHAVTRQYFTVQLAGRADPDWSALASDELRVLSAARHSRKLPRGALEGNRFRIVLRGASGDRDAAAARLDAIACRGVPNYFGEQRFGFGGSNVEQARAMFAGRRVKREQRSILLSAARSEIYNAVLAARVADASWDRALDGEVFALDGTNSVFGPEALTPATRERMERLDVHSTGPLWGRGALRTAADAARLEQEVAARHADLCAGLEEAGLRQERRALRVAPRELASEWLAEDALAVSFSLRAGAYATTVLRELASI
jgi:tRNA pseudouridine13 synthase